MTDMNRRNFLSAVSVGLTVGIAGCSELPGSNETQTPPLPESSGNQTDTPEPIETPENGYIDSETGEIRWDEIDKDPEYIFAAQEAYIYGQDYLEYAFEHAKFVLDEALSNDPNYETIEERFTYGQNATEAARLAHEKAIELLSEHGGEKQALSAIQDNLENTVGDLEDLVEDINTLIQKRKAGDRGYVAEHDSTLYRRYETIRGGNTPWRAIESRINSEYYNPGPS